MMEMVGADQYMRYTDEHGKTTVQHHRVIAGGRFVGIQIAEYAKVAAEKGKSKVKAEAITKETYDREFKR